jgi:signal transduction histidine kinase/ligand-binding sensor domain-containing protein
LNRFIFIILLYIITGPARLYAQQRRGPFIAYGSESKYLSSQNFTVHQSAGGYLWIGTQSGLVRFDGKRYKNFFSQPGNPASPSDNTIVDITEDKNGDLWFCGFFHGLTRYNTTTGTFKKYARPTRDDFPYYGIYCGLKDQRGNLWFGTGGRGLAKYSYEKDSFELFYPEPNNCKDGSVRGDNYVTGICEDSFDGNTLWCTSFKGLYAFDKTTGQFTHYSTGLRQKYAVDITMNCVEAGAGGRLWLGSWGEGLLCFNVKTKRFEHGKRKPVPAIINHIRLVNDSTLYLACFSDGLYQYHLKTNAYTNISPPAAPGDLAMEGFNANKISVTANAGIFTGGNHFIYQLHPAFNRLRTNMRFPDAQPGSDITIQSCIWDAQRRCYWLGTAGGSGLYRFGSAGAAIHPVSVAGKKEGEIFYNLNSDGLQRVWVAGHRQGLFLWSDERQRFEKPAAAALPPLPDSVLNHIFRMQSDAAGNLWLLSDRTVYYWNVKTHTAEAFPLIWQPGYKGPEILLPARLIAGTENDLWVLTQTGLFHCERNSKKTTHLYYNAAGPGKQVSNEYLDGLVNKYKTLWLTSGNGLGSYDRETGKFVNNHSVEDGLPSMMVRGLAADSSGNVWANTVAGLALFDAKKKMWSTFDRFDGLEREYLDVETFITANQKIIIDQGNGFVLRDVAAMQATSQPPVIRFTEVKINEKLYSLEKLPASGVLRLLHSQNNVQIEFAAMDWLYPAKTRYVVKIEGLEKTGTWIPNTDARIYLAGLSPGKYMVRVKALSSSGQWSPEIALTVIVKKPFWRTTGFIAGIILLALSLLYFLYRYRIGQLKELHSMRNRISRNLHDDIGASLSNINILNELARRNAANPHKTTQYLEKAGEDIQRISESLADIVWNINPENDMPESLFVRMMRYAADMAEARNIACSFSFPGTEEGLNMDMDKRRDIYLVFKEAVNNLVKYSGATEASVVLSVAGKTIRLQVTDNGRGFDAATSKTGNGLQNMRQRAQTWGGRLTVSSTPGGGGTTLLLEMPL